jgi:hypothetical protein
LKNKKFDSIFISHSNPLKSLTAPLALFEIFYFFRLCPLQFFGLLAAAYSAAFKGKQGVMPYGFVLHRGTV